jgi:Na+/proline symporter
MQYAISDMSADLATVDFTAMAIYIAIITYLGYSASRKQSSEGFLIADRNLNVLSTAASIVASKTGAGVILTFVALYYLYGISAMSIFVGVSTGYLVFIPFAVRLRQLSSVHKFYTLSDYFFHRHGKTVGLLSALAVLVVTVLLLLMQLIGGAKIFARLSGFPYSVSLTIVVVVILVYVVLGGFRAVVRTDVAQLLCIMSLIAIVAFSMARGSAGSSSLRFWSGRASPQPMSIVCFFAMGVLMPFFAAELWQRVYAARDVKTIRSSLMLSALVFVLIGLLLAVIASIVSANLHDIDPDMAMVEGLTRLIPVGFLGFGLVIFLASIMSSADSCLFASVAIVLQDFYARFRPTKHDGLVRHFRYTIGLLLLICSVLAIGLRDMVSATYIAVAFGCVIGTVVLVSWLFAEARPAALAGAIVAGFAGTLVMIVVGPVKEYLIVEAIGFTILGLVLVGLPGRLFCGKSVCHDEQYE